MSIRRWYLIRDNIALREKEKYIITSVIDGYEFFWCADSENNASLHDDVARCVKFETYMDAENFRYKKIRIHANIKIFKCNKIVLKLRKK